MNLLVGFMLVRLTISTGDCPNITVGTPRRLAVADLGSLSHVTAISRDHLRAAAQLRTDSLQVVAALEVGCTAFLTSDRDLPTIPGLRILQLSSYVK